MIISEPKPIQKKGSFECVHSFLASFSRRVEETLKLMPEKCDSHFTAINDLFISSSAKEEKNLVFRKVFSPTGKTGLSAPFSVC